MPISRVLVLASTISVLIGTMTRGDAILTLGVVGNTPDASAPVAGWRTSNLAWPASTVVASAPALSGSSFNLATSDATNQVSSPTSTPVPSPWPSAVPAPAPAPAPTPSPVTYDAFVNLGAAPYPNSGSLTTGNALPWYDSPKIIGLFGGPPTTPQQVAFNATVLQRVEQTFALGGVPVKLTDDPTAPAAHTLSVVSNAVNPSMGTAIGMTNLGGDGFHFIDNSAPYARSLDQLEWIVAHNVAHELMLAFGVPENYDHSGKYIDSTVGQMAMFLNPGATFSPDAIQALLSKDFQVSNGWSFLAGAQLIDPSPVPEPTTWALWGLGALAACVARRRGRSGRASA